jgi:hypothetical protein
MDRIKSLYLIVVIIALIVIAKIYSSRPHGDISLTISKNRTEIVNLDTKRDVYYKEKLYIDKIDFENSPQLKHKMLGNLGVVENLFMDFDIDIKSQDTRDVIFEITSDDGFRLFVDNMMIGEHNADRPYSYTRVNYKLTKGNHNIKLLYFQRYSNMGIKAKFIIGKDEYIFGEKNPYISYR